MTHSKTAAIRTAIVVIAALFLAGCMSVDHGVKLVAGAGVGGVAGGVPGSTARNGKPGIAATVTGTMARLFLGSGIGASLDRANRLYAARTRQAAQKNRPGGVPSRLFNPDISNAGAITPTRTYRSASRIYCREY